MGKIDPARFAGGSIPIYPDKAETALVEHIGKAIGADLETAAYGVAEIVDENMANAARVHAVESGVAVADRTLIAFGGAAPLHASRLAEKLAIDRVIIPPSAGVGSAVGFLRAPAAYEIVRSRYTVLDKLVADEVNQLLTTMASEAAAQVRSAAGSRPLTVTRGGFMRYAGQGHEIFVMLPDGEIGAGDAPALRDKFEAEYRRLFARHIPGAEIEIMSWTVSVSTERARMPAIAPVADVEAATAIGRSSVFDAGREERVDADVYARDQLAKGTRISGPAIVVEEGTSTLISTRFDAHVDGGGALVLTRKEAN